MNIYLPIYLYTFNQKKEKKLNEWMNEKNEWKWKKKTNEKTEWIKKTEYEEYTLTSEWKLTN